MSQRTVITCDRCGDENATKETSLVGAKKGRKPKIPGPDKDVDLCEGCFQTLLDIHHLFIEQAPISVAGKDI